MRIWSLHPRFLDRQGLLGLWRETIQAKNALLDLQHSSNVYHERQLRRFKFHSLTPVKFIGAYLKTVSDEMLLRGYRPDPRFIPEDELTTTFKIPVTTGQIDFEIGFLKAKLIERQASEIRILRLQVIRRLFTNQLNPIFTEVAGDIEPWEKL